MGALLWPMAGVLTVETHQATAHSRPSFLGSLRGDVKIAERLLQASKEHALACSFEACKSLSASLTH